MTGTRGNEKEKNSPGSAFHRITKLTGQMLDAHIKRSETFQKTKAGGKKVQTPISSARSTPTVHWDPVTTTCTNIVEVSFYLKYGTTCHSRSLYERSAVIYGRYSRPVHLL